MSRDAEIAKEVTQANVPLSALSTTLTKLRQRAVREWIASRAWERETAGQKQMQGVWLHNATDNAPVYRKTWHRLAAELVLAGQAVMMISTANLGQMLTSDSQQNYESLGFLGQHDHLFLDQFCYNNNHEGNPMLAHERHALRSYITNWIEQGKALYPYVETSDFNVLDEWWGGASWIIEENTTKIDLAR